MLRNRNKLFVLLLIISVCFYCSNKQSASNTEIIKSILNVEKITEIHVRQIDLEYNFPKVIYFKIENWRPDFSDTKLFDTLSKPFNSMDCANKLSLIGVSGRFESMYHDFPSQESLENPFNEYELSNTYTSFFIRPNFDKRVSCSEDWNTRLTIVIDNNNTYGILDIIE